MSESAIDNQASPNPRKRSSSLSLVLPAVFLFGAVVMGADFTAITLEPLRVLHIPYPNWLDYSHFLIPGACTILWLALRRKWPIAGAVFAVVLCFTLISFVPKYAQSRVANVHVRHSIDSDDLKLIEGRIGAPIFESGSAEGDFLLIAPGNEQRLRAELGPSQILNDGTAR